MLFFAELLMYLIWIEIFSYCAVMIAIECKEDSPSLCLSPESIRSRTTVALTSESVLTRLILLVCPELTHPPTP